MSLDELKGIIEGLLFVAGEDGLTEEQLASILKVERETVQEALHDLEVDLKEMKRGMQLIEMAGAYQLTTKPEHALYFQQLVEAPGHTGLSQAALETLAIVAYKQPITRVEIEEIRGVKTEKAIQTLTAKLLIKDVGRAEGSGRAILYGTTKEFLDYFGLKSLKELPPLPDQVDEGFLEEDADLFFKKFEEGMEPLLSEDNSES
ncbi:SMC-Scp complex subunit ScpB [Alkalihalobacterium chitinilyticum]|uniref:Segregation and condensation protein B n=1 Tax=Alkalihalobacterium chitinilyticum TaxID=2980103 RepID=A0ABT5V9A0_9BACI|nr:SMC-Scp complex subunit ScpB [Alkalihalobacterium chitinilyticum]MDE5412026.1 SMC-Scp complex subunit ScpB [Alkalihalobacterium chitinilyticum]